MADKPPSQQGFTLVELAITLTIIGLIVSGVLVGQEVIAAAKVRKQLTQLEEFDAALTAFQAKFYCVPGDCKPESGITNATGNGDNLINFELDWSSTAENALAPSQMADQGMIGGVYTPGVTFDTSMIPASNLAGQIMFGSTDNTNMAVLAEWGGNAPLTTAAALPTKGAYAVDAKRDDGNPITGFVRAITGGNTDPFDPSSAAGTNIPAGTGDPADCRTADASGVYNVGTDTGICALRIRING